MAEPTSPKATPKRKRDDVISEQRLSVMPTNNPLAKTIFSFQAPDLHQVRQMDDLPEDGSSSPRSKVAQRFGDLAIIENGSGGGVITTSATDDDTSRAAGGTNPSHTQRRANGRISSPELCVFDFDAGSGDETAGEEMQLDDEDEDASRKRAKFPELEVAKKTLDTGTGPNGESGADAIAPIQLGEANEKLVLEQGVDPSVSKTTKSGGTGRLQKSYPSINRLSDSKSRARKRGGTPPLATKRKTVLESTSTEEEAVIVDPIRAALTWHEDEITVYDPEDKDDDGTGINGIGFKPTPAIAYARAQRRRQQLAEYKKREESEARARRTQRRREQLGGGAAAERKHSIVRVHFSDAEPTMVLTT